VSILKEIEEGIVVFDNPYGGSNITSVTTTEGTFLIDASLFPSKAEEVVLYIKRLLKSDVTMLANTHYHPDHSFGNSGVSSPLVASEKTEQYFSLMNRNYIDEVVKKENALKDENVKIVHPAITFRKEHEINLGGLTIEMEVVGGHTPDSTVIRIPERKVIIMGDILVCGYHPEIVTDSDLEKWIKTLKQIRRERYKWLIPGHGKTCGKIEIDKMISYLQKTLMVRDYSKNIEDVVTGLGNDPNFRERKMQSLFLENIRVIMENREIS